MFYVLKKTSAYQMKELLKTRFLNIVYLAVVSFVDVLAVYCNRNMNN